MDEDTKEGDRRYGDYVLWSQLMDQAKAASTPVIFVTSEKKEDWWEQKGHLTLGPRLELLEEFSRETGQRIHVYRTERFLELHAARAGSKLNEHVVEEIREVDARRGRLQAPAVSLIEQVALVARPTRTGELWRSNCFARSEWRRRAGVSSRAWRGARCGRNRDIGAVWLPSP